MTTVEKAERLVQFLKLTRREADPIIDNVLDKLLDRERHNLLKQRDELKAELEDFEQQYGITSSEFYLKFERGEVGDALDFVDWSGAWRVYQTIEGSLAILDAEPAIT